MPLRKLFARPPKHVFVLCTGRCGSTTFARACGHMTNWSAAHESRCHLLGPNRLDYPRGHIEVDNRLSWLLGRLDDRFGHRAFYVHLQRDTNATAESFVKRSDKGILRAYRADILMGAVKNNPNTPTIDFCLDYCHTVNANIELFLKDKPYQMQFQLESACDDFAEFWKRIGADGDLDAALKEWDTPYNASPVPSGANGSSSP